MQTYKSKFGYSIFVFALVGCVAPSLISLLQNSGSNYSLGAFIGPVVIIGLVLYLNWSTKYIINDNTLTVRCGFIYHKTFDIQKFVSIQKTRSHSSSPAPSLDRIEIKIGTLTPLIISPKNATAFARALVQINPAIENRL